MGFAKLIFFPRQKLFCSERFSFSEIPKKKFWWEKINLAKKAGPFLIHKIHTSNSLNIFFVNKSKVELPNIIF
jgi:hypothetical protein